MPDAADMVCTRWFVPFRSSQARIGLNPANFLIVDLQVQLDSDLGRLLGSEPSPGLWWRSGPPGRPPPGTLLALPGSRNTLG